MPSLVFLLLSISIQREWQNKASISIATITSLVWLSWLFPATRMLWSLWSMEFSMVSPLKEAQGGVMIHFGKMVAQTVHMTKRNQKLIHINNSNNQNVPQLRLVNTFLNVLMLMWVSVSVITRTTLHLLITVKWAQLVSSTKFLRIQLLTPILRWLTVMKAPFQICPYCHMIQMAHWSNVLQWSETKLGL